MRQPTRARWALASAPVPQLPGVIVMELTSAPPGASAAEGTVDPAFDRLVAIFNCTPAEQALPFPPSVPQGAALQVSDAPRGPHVA